MIIVSNKDKAWEEVNKLFPTDYMKDEQSSVNAGYPVYRSTAEDHFYYYICDLGTCLEVNTPQGTTRVNIILNTYFYEILAIKNGTISARILKADSFGDAESKYHEIYGQDTIESIRRINY